ncbi:uncharacterized protein VICG_00174 [Vittaforma corneae ATCC 50505]|uniref:Spc7 kinetochore protein domain-containing protein n=1 Tax=Vittaforma corneae (strain ATCC 50505) TaxID=993615 RepID=L2GQF9_VITCO|nr:uncharacterized protein VICG_00174 [Vittaforma corneae ATCC 50505]ELA42859.1 hypothetical protein VICG_00174 [Vittaforma corneae ATCC 50505]
MDQDKQESRRRVSFAAEPQINYIYQKENNTSMTSSCSMDMAMDITTELAEFKNLNLFSKDYSANAEDVCDVENMLEIKENESNGLSKRVSLDPLKAIEHESFSESSTTAANLGNSSTAIQNVQDKIDDAEHPTKEVEAKSPDAKSKDQTQSIFWRSSIKDEHRKSLNVSFDDTGAINSSFGVEELVNTIDLRKIIPQEWQAKTSIGEFLASQGIRFLDETVMGAMKRDTLSKSRNVVDPSLVLYYKYSLSERIEFLYQFSGFLIDKMKDLQKEIEEVESGIDVSGINKDNLKRIRNEARNKSKIDWYSLRKIYEIQFNKKMIENKSKIVDLLNDVKRQNMKTVETIYLKEQSVNSLRSKISELKEKVSRFEKENVQKTEKLQAMIEEKKKVYESAQNDFETILQSYETQKKEECMIQKRIDRLHQEISSLKKNIAIKNVGESQLDEVKRQLERYGSIYHFKIIKISKHAVLFEVAGNVVSVEVNSLSEVVEFSFVKSDGDPFSEFSRSLIQNSCCRKLVDFIRTCLENFYLCFSLRKEVNAIKEKAKVECFYLNSCLYFRIYPPDSKVLLDMSITDEFDLIYNERICHNLKLSPGSLSLFISEKLIK